MKICINCGVELDDGMNPCPLCGMDPAVKAGQEEISENSPSSIIRLQRKENRRYLWELSGIVAFSGIVACTIIDLMLTKSLHWSLYSDVSISAAWVIVSLFLFLHKKPLILASILMMIILAVLFIINLFSGAGEWFFPVGLPVTVCAFGVAFAIIILYRTVDFRGLNIIASAILLLAGFIVVIELSLDNFINGKTELRWSLITAVSILPVSLILFFYHYRLKKGNRLDSLFHV